MDVPLQVSFRNMDPSAAVEADVREKVGRLERLYDRIISCRVVVEAPHRHHRKGKLYDVLIDITVPGSEIAVRRSGPENQAHKDVYVAVRDAFDAAARRLQDHVRIAKRHVKTHTPPLRGTVARLFRDRGYGFIDATAVGEVYFHRNSVVDGSFDRLEVGDDVRLVIADRESAQGAQASTVQPAGRHRSTG